jgi:hypothetical protein
VLTFIYVTLKNLNMGKMKNLVIDQMNEDPIFDSAGYMSADNQMHPPPDEINLESGLSKWIIKDYKIWAKDYTQALELLTMIESF